MKTYIIAQQLTNGLILGSIYGLIAVGYTMVYGVIGMINFAHGEIYMISAYLTAIFIAICMYLGVNSLLIIFTISVFFTLTITGLYGYIIEKLAYKPLRNSSRLSALIAAIGVSLLLQNYVQLSQGADTKGIPHLITGVFKFGSNDEFVQISTIQAIILITAFIAMFLLNKLVNKTAMGRNMRATQQDSTMANLLGINTDKTISHVFIIGSVMAAIAGFLISINYGSFDFYIGFITGVKAFTAAVLGGIGSLPGAMLGGIILGLAESLFSGFVSTDFKDVFAFSLLIVILIFKPNGILGKPIITKV